MQNKSARSAYTPSCRGFGIAKILKKRQLHPRQGCHPMDVGCIGIKIGGDFAMLKFKGPRTATAMLTLTCLAASPALALSPVTYVSGKGTDSGTCASPANPCRTFQFAVNQTTSGGEVKALDAADYR